jgi:hypothetical protein
MARGSSAYKGLAGGKGAARRANANRARAKARSGARKSTPRLF